MKKFFHFSAIVAMLSMMATATVATSCSDDDDDDAVVTKDTVFTVNMGGTSSKAGSFLSVKNCAVYTTGDLASYAGDVEIVFNGSNFISADKSANEAVASNGNTAEITNTSSTTWTYTTSTGFSGSITMVEEPGDPSATYVVTVARKLAE